MILLDSNAWIFKMRNLKLPNVFKKISILLVIFI